MPRLRLEKPAEIDVGLRLHRRRRGRLFLRGVQCHELRDLRQVGYLGRVRFRGLNSNRFPPSISKRSLSPVSSTTFPWKAWVVPQS